MPAKRNAARKTGKHAKKAKSGKGVADEWRKVTVPVLKAFLSANDVEFDQSISKAGLIVLAEDLEASPDDVLPSPV